MAGCCAQMVGFAVMSFRENGWGGLVSQGLGTSMLQMPNIVKNPRVWIAPTLASAITGPIATCVFHLEMNGAPINSGMGTCGLCGQLGVWTGWVAPSEKALANGAAGLPTALDLVGLILDLLPSLFLTWAFASGRSPDQAGDLTSSSQIPDRDVRRPLLSICSGSGTGDSREEQRAVSRERQVQQPVKNQSRRIGIPSVPSKSTDAHST